ncbi:hypothetical protein P3G55_08400 [Leptospira sp. 96542]|nr:hypothetical protein [Leptospira sp. 96542]
MFRSCYYPILFLILITPSLMKAAPGTYDEAAKELVRVWETKYPLPFKNITKKDPLKQGIRQTVRKSGTYFQYNFEIFMPKYRREGVTPIAMEEGRKLVLYFLWNPVLAEKHRIELGEPNEGK